ncbi:16S rRNA (adenine(1518)-N(6)/adenine(1519)-N(6))-dimethyltransferase RsmA [Buchnera aphidicola]|uniref:16S rRNA (adenine(1518)-N(6)/adenine(1519)-N(6))- dimethyltransferase RsmA n=1 Tax=Buchnera aphidicola TaxID=9 RepID=UPI003BEEEC17
MKKNIYQKHIPLKKFGQNFLIDKIIINNIIQWINPKNSEVLVEIGPGLAALTEPICNMVDSLIIIEIDSNLLELLKNKNFFSKLIIFNKNALTFDYLKLFHNQKLIRIFGNLPYNISVSLIIYLFKKIYIIKDMHFMIQKEVADRLIATPGNKSYGRLSILAQYYCHIKIIFNVLPESFFPIPKVYSVFVQLIPRKKYPIYVYDINILSYITNIAFQKRRKILRHSLSSLFSVDKLITLGIDPTLRAENISVLQYCKLANYLFNNKCYN